METITEAVGSEIEVYANIRKQAFGLGNTVISEAADEIAELIQKGKRIPDDKKKMVMQWFFKQKELDQAERVIELKEQGNEREERLVDNILKESMFARAITLDEVEAVEADFEEEIKDEREIENLPRPSSLQESATNEEKGSLATSEG